MLMKLPNLSALITPTLALSLTASAMFVTVSASVAQEAGLPLPIEVAPIPHNDIPAVPHAAGIDPNSVLHDRQHHISLDANGGFAGRLVTLDSGTTSPASGMNVSIIRGGSVVASTVTSVDGSFNVSGVGEGVVTVVGTSPTGLLLFSIHLRNDGNVFAVATPVGLETKTVELGVHTAVVSSSDLATVKQLIMGALPSGNKRFNSDLADSDKGFPHSSEEGESSTSTRHHPVQLQADGSLRGQVNLRNGSHRDVVDLTLHFVRHGQHVGATEVQRDGRFQMAGLAPGQYSIVTTGKDGILAMGIDVVGSLAQVEKDDEFKLTSIVQTLDLSVSPAQPGDFNAQNAQQLISSDPSLADAGFGGEMPVGGGPLGGPAGGAPGGGTGGGGTGGGGGGLGGLLGAAAAAAAGYAIGNDRSASPRR